MSWLPAGSSLLVVTGKFACSAPETAVIGAGHKLDVDLLSGLAALGDIPGPRRVVLTREFRAISCRTLAVRRDSVRACCLDREKGPADASGLTLGVTESL